MDGDSWAKSSRELVFPGRWAPSILIKLTSAQENIARPLPSQSSRGEYPGAHIHYYEESRLDGDSLTHNYLFFQICNSITQNLSCILKTLAINYICPEVIICPSGQFKGSEVGRRQKETDRQMDQRQQLIITLATPKSKEEDVDSEKGKDKCK